MAQTEPKRAKPTMQYRALGKTDMKVSTIALGCFAFGGDRKMGSHAGASFSKLHAGVWGDQDEADTFATVKAALDAGVNLFDNAEMYADGYAEEVMGRALEATGYKRSDYYIATKVSESYLAPALLKQHLDASLERIGTDYIDLYQIHWASRAALRTERYPDRALTAEVPLEDTLRALQECKDAGKIKHIGVCNFGVQDLKRALATGVEIVSNQICYNLLWRGIEDEVVPFCMENNISILPWSPLGQALLTGKVSHADEVVPGRARSRLFSNKRPQQRHGEPGLEEEAFSTIAKVRWISEKLDQPMANVALAWARERPGVSSLLMGARNTNQLERNLTSLDLQLPPEVQALLTDAGEEVKQKLGKNLDPYESAATTRIY